MQPIIVVMGVCGCGKSTVGQLLAMRLGGKFLEGDDFHRPEAVAKMQQGIPLEDEDRAEWLEKLAGEIGKQGEGALVLACSALKERYRDVLKRAAPARVIFTHLHGEKETLMARLQQRKGHFMPLALLGSQLETLEVPEEGFCFDISRQPDEIVNEICFRFGL